MPYLDQDFCSHAACCAVHFDGPPTRHFAGLRNIMNINEVQRSNGVTRRNLVDEWCDKDRYLFVDSIISNLLFSRTSPIVVSDLYT